MPYREDTEAYRCILDGPYHLEPDCPVGRLIPPELRVQGHGGAAPCRTCEMRREARARQVTQGTERLGG